MIIVAVFTGMVIFWSVVVTIAFKNQPDNVPIVNSSQAADGH